VTVTHEEADPIASHLEFFGYSCHPSDGNWVDATHPRRWDFSYIKGSYGWRLYAAVIVGKSLGEWHAAFLEAINGINEKSVVTKFTALKDSDGDYVVRLRAVYTSGYDKRDFGMFMDQWHSDEELLSELPQLPKDEPARETSGESKDGKPGA
jgi:hypothetical protein